MMNKMSGAVEFAAPKGFAAPEGVQAGVPFEMVATFQVTDGGGMKLLKVGDYELGAAEEKPTYKPDYSEYSRGIMGGGEAEDEMS